MKRVFLGIVIELMWRMRRSIQDGESTKSTFVASYAHGCIVLGLGYKCGHRRATVTPNCILNFEIFCLSSKTGFRVLVIYSR